MKTNALATIAEHGVDLLGETRVIPAGGGIFHGPARWRLVLLIFKSGSTYVGETGRYDREGAAMCSSSPRPSISGADRSAGQPLFTEFRKALNPDPASAAGAPFAGAMQAR
jgi:hypothetical protein